MIALLSYCSILTGQDWKWAKTLNNSHRLGKIYECGNDGFYLIGAFKDSVDIDGQKLTTAGISEFIGRFDTSGVCQWLKVIGRPHEACSDGINLYVVHGGKLEKISPNGSIVNSTLVTGRFFCKIGLNTKKQIIIAASFKDTLKYGSIAFKDSSAVILKLDSTLQLIEAAETSSFDSPQQVEIDSDNTIFLVANKSFPCMYCGVTRILKFSDNLSLLVNHEYSVGVGSHYYSEPYVRCFEEGLLVMQGNAYFNHDAKLYTRNIQKVREWPLGWSGGVKIFDNRMYAIGVSRGTDCGNRIGVASVFMALDTGVNCQWNKTLQLDNPLTGPGAWFSDFIIVGSNGYMVGAIDKPVFFDSITVSPTPHQGYFQDMFIAKLKMKDINLNVVNSDDNEFPIIIYPNPSLSKFKFESKKQVESFEVKTMLGEIILNKQIYSDLFEVDLNEQAKGIYLIQVKIQDRYFVKRIIKN